MLTVTVHRARLALLPLHKLFDLALCLNHEVRHRVQLVRKARLNLCDFSIQQPDEVVFQLLVDWNFAFLTVDFDRLKELTLEVKLLHTKLCLHLEYIVLEAAQDIVNMRPERAHL